MLRAQPVKAVSASRRRRKCLTLCTFLVRIFKQEAQLSLSNRQKRFAQKSTVRMIVRRGIIVVGFSGDAIKFIRHQTVSSGLTYLSRHTVTYLSVRMRSVT